MIANAERNSITCRDAALTYRHWGWSVVPLEQSSKRPAVPWKRYQKVLATLEEIDEWWPLDDPDRHGVAIVCGRISELIVVDVDPRSGGLETIAKLRSRGHVLPETLTVESGRGDGGTHSYLHLAAELRSSKLGPGVDLKAEGGYVVAPPSLHPDTGHAYEFSNSLPVAEATAWIVEVPRQPAPSSTSRIDPASQPREQARVREGSRNDWLTSKAGSMRAAGLSTEAIEAALQVENPLRCDPPLDRAEVGTIARSVGRYVPGEGWRGPDIGWFAEAVSTIARDVLVDHLYTATDGMVGVHLASHGNDAFPTLGTLAAELGGGRDPENVGLHLRAVARAGRLEIRPRLRPNGSFTSNQYHFVLGPIAKGSSATEDSAIQLKLPDGEQ